MISTKSKSFVWAFNVVVSIAVISLLGISSCRCEEFDFYNLTGNDEQIMRADNKPLLSLNTNVSQAFLLGQSNFIYLGQMLNFIFTGSYGGGQLTLDSNSSEANNTLDSILALGVELLATSIDKDPPPNFNDTVFTELVLHLNDILTRLNSTGSSAVYVGDFIPFFPYLTAQNILGLIFKLFSAQWKENFQKYLIDEYLGGISGKCKQDTALFFRDIQGGEFWAIQMFDSTAKIPPGIISANINWLGSYKGCTAIKNETYQISGKYCRADIKLPVQQFSGDLAIDENIGLNYGLCVSQSCDNDQVNSLVSNALKILAMFKFASVKQIKCDDTQTTEIPNNSRVYMIILGIIAFIVVLMTIIDIIVRLMEPKNDLIVDTPDMVKWKTEIAGANVIKPVAKKSEPRRNKLVEFAINCSLYSNIEKFFRTDNGGKITCLNGIRFFSMVWIVWGHTYNYASYRYNFFLLDNIADLQELNEQLYAQIIINGMYGVDTFFLMSAFLLTISFLRKLEKSGGLQLGEWIYYYVHRYWRLAPPFLITFVIFIWIVPYVGSGPLWVTDEIPPNSADCRNYWWSFILFLNNFVPEGRGSTCMGYLWYIPNDYQFYAISPIFIILLFKYPKMGTWLLSFTLSASIFILAFLSANVYESRKRDIIQVLTDMWADVYIKPYCRASPWIIGIFLGYLFFKKKTVKLNMPTVALGWIITIIFAVTAIFGGYTNHAPDKRRMEVAEYAAFFSLTKLTWPLAISWIIFACHYGYGGFINSILSYRAYVPLNRLSYCAYLVHPPIMVMFYHYQRQLFHGTTITLIYVFFGHLLMTFIVAFFFTLFYEIPFIAVEKLIYNPRQSH